jgi:hypothetical protein
MVLVVVGRGGGSESRVDGGGGEAVRGNQKKAVATTCVVSMFYDTQTHDRKERERERDREREREKRDVAAGTLTLAPLLMPPTTLLAFCILPISFCPQYFPCNLLLANGVGVAEKKVVCFEQMG